MIRLSLPAVALFALIALVPATSASGQTADVKSVVSNAASAVDGLSARQVGISRAALVEHTRQVEAAPAGATDALAQARRGRRGMPLMVVGGAAFLAGLIIGDAAGTAIAVGGAAIGLYGLYLWAQTQ